MTYKELKEAAKTSMGYKVCNTCSRRRIEPHDSRTTCKECSPPPYPPTE